MGTRFETPQVGKASRVSFMHTIEVDSTANITVLTNESTDSSGAGGLGAKPTPPAEQHSYPTDAKERQNVQRKAEKERAKLAGVEPTKPKNELLLLRTPMKIAAKIFRHLPMMWTSLHIASGPIISI